MLESPKIHLFLPLLGLILGATVQAAETLLITDIPADVIATEAKVMDPTDMNSFSGVVIPDTAQLRRTVEQYVDTIEELQRSHGIFHDRIGEELIGLGLAYKNLGQYRQAIDAFKRSLHINRINQGLHNPNQLALLELLIETNSAVSDWEALDQNYHYLYWVNRRIFGENDPRLIPVIERLGTWHLNEYQLESGPIPFKHLLSADILFQDAVDIIEASFGANDPRLINALYRIALANCHMASHAGNPDTYEEIRSSARSIGRMERMPENMQELIRDSYRRGKKAMLRITDIYANNPQLPADAHGIALTHLGDWYLLFDRSSTARKTYEIAYAKLTESGIQQDDIDRFFSQPRSLPAIKLPIEYQQDDSNDSYVIVKFDVTKSGWARNIEIIESSPVNKASLHHKAKRTIRATRFRPRIEDGRPVEAPDVNIKYMVEE